MAFTDDDVICEPNYIQGIATVFSSCSADAAQGRVLLDCEGGWPKWLDGNYLAMMADFRDYGNEVIDLDGTLCGTNMVVKAGCLKKLAASHQNSVPLRQGCGKTRRFHSGYARLGLNYLRASDLDPTSRGHASGTKAFLRSRYFGQGRAQAYYEPLPVPLSRFGLYVIKETIVQECAAIWNLCAGRPAEALACQCQARSQAGLFWQHWLFKRGVRRELSACLSSPTCK